MLLQAVNFTSYSLIRRALKGLSYLEIGAHLSNVSLWAPI